MAKHEAPRPDSEIPVVMEGFCTCTWTRLGRIPMKDCGLSRHRIEARQPRPKA